MKGIIITCFMAITLSLSAQQVAVPVWPKGATESNGITAPEKVLENGIIENISTASFTVYPANKANNTGAAIVICPGGSYVVEAAKHEGSEFASWFAENGITGIVLKYRIPNGHYEIPSNDALEAIRIVRSRASEWNINPQKIGIAGFSAGGHLASTVLTHFDNSSRPDFGILFYPVITMNEEVTHMGSRQNLIGNNYDAHLVNFYSNEKQIKENTPPTLLLLSDDDKAVIPENSLLFYQGLKNKNIPSSMYIYPDGNHGWGFNKDFRYHEQMKAGILDWLSQQKVIPNAH